MMDIILGNTPPQAFVEPVFALAAAVVSALVFAFLYFHFMVYRQISGLWFQRMIMAADTLGLGVFTVAGVRAAFDHGMGFNYFLMPARPFWAPVSACLYGSGSGGMRQCP